LASAAAITKGPLDSPSITFSGLAFLSAGWPIGSIPTRGGPSVAAVMSAGFRWFAAQRQGGVDAGMAAAAGRVRLHRRRHQVERRAEVPHRARSGFGLGRRSTLPVTGAKRRASYVKCGLVAFSVLITMADFRHFGAGRWIMPHMLARGFAPLAIFSVKPPASRAVSPRLGASGGTGAQCADC